MKRIKFLFLFIIIGAIAASTLYFGGAELLAGKFAFETQPDLPFKRNKAKMSMEDYLILRDEHLDLLRGFDTAQPDSREKAVRAMEAAEADLARRGDAPSAAWRFLGPAPIPIGATNGYSGRVSAIAVHPTNPNIVYVGTAQGGLYRTLNGGTTWTAMMDSALTIAIGAVAIAPSDPTTVFVGTGESTLCGSGCYIGVGLYRITNAETSPVLSGPLNKNAAGADIFSGRAISEILVHPTDPNILFASSTTGRAGIGSTTTGLALPAEGVYRTFDAMSANPTFTKLAIGGTFGTDRAITDMVMEPGDPTRVYIGAIGGAAGDGGAYYSSNALDPAPTWTQLLSTLRTGSQSRIELAATKVAGTTTVYAASGENNGTVYKSVNAGTFTQTVSNGFCNPQCFYDIAIAVDPTDANRVYLGGSPALVFGRSSNGGTSFPNSSSSLHVDTQAFGLAPSDPNIMYFGSDGGMWKTTNVRSPVSVPWTTLNNSTFSATQFMGIALHPVDRNYTLGGTQDNGTEFLAPNGTTWVFSDGGDGGFAVIDQTSPTINDVVAYHTYFNQTNNQIGFARATTTEPSGDPFWSEFYGCGGVANGLNCADSVLFYAPMVGGPVAPDSGDKGTLYFGTNKLYRSADLGITMTPVSGTLPLAGTRVSAIAIAPQNDNIRMIGSTTGRVYLSTTAGATTMTDVSGPIATVPRYVGRIAIDPDDANIAYVALNGFGLANGGHVWKTTNLLSGSPTWEIAGIGIPDTPVNSFAIDPKDTANLFAGTDIGVFRSTNGGTSWTPFSPGLPRVAVFGMEVHPIHRVLKIATHGRGIWEYDLSVPSTAVTSDFDGDSRSDLAVFRGSDGNWYRRLSSDGSDVATGWGLVGDIVTPGDYDGDSKTDPAVYRPSEGVWYVNPSTGGFTQTNFGLASDLPTQGDYDGDGLTDLAVYRPSTGEWYLKRTTEGLTTVQFGVSGDKPVPGDYDGDGKTDIAVYRPSQGVWYLNRSRDGFTAIQFGLGDDLVVPADYDGDAKADIAIYRPSSGQWYVLRSQAGLIVHQWGISGDIPTPGDYDGDGKADVSVFRPSDGNWYRINSQSGSFFQSQYGLGGDKPIPAGYVPVQ